MLDKTTLPLLKGSTNLLAFSAGVDSTALFHLLLEAEIPFDIALVNYHTRVQSDREAEHARLLAERFGKRCFILDAEPIESNFEAEAREVRYAFFETLIQTHGYVNLLTAHQLDDRLEWLLMQLCKGAGLPELLGMSAVAERENYRLVRPLLDVSKAELKSWLQLKEIRFFEDESNQDEAVMRNRFRNRYSAALLEEYRTGIGNSLRFLERDASALKGEKPDDTSAEILLTRTSQDRLGLMRQADRWLKQHGYLLRQGERERILHENEIELGRRFVLSLTPECTLIVPRSRATMSKEFKERCRRLGIGPGARPYLFEHPALFESVVSRLASWPYAG